MLAVYSPRGHGHMSLKPVVSYEGVVITLRHLQELCYLDSVLAVFSALVGHLIFINIIVSTLNF